MTNFYKTHGATVIIPDKDLIEECQKIVKALNTPVPKTRKIDLFPIYYTGAVPFLFLIAFDTRYSVLILILTLVVAYLEKGNDQ